MLDRVNEDLNKYFAEMQSSEENYQELYKLTEARTYKIVDELESLIKKLDGFDYGFNTKRIVLDFLNEVL